MVNEEYAVSPDGMKMFGVLDLETQMDGCRFSIGIRNSHDKSLRLFLTAGLRLLEYGLQRRFRTCNNVAMIGQRESTAFSWLLRLINLHEAEDLALERDSIVTTAETVQ